MTNKNTAFTTGLVSIVTPVYNNEAYLGEMLDSILNQSYNHIQMILVNDGSTDSTAEIAGSYEDKFKQRGFEYIFVQADHKSASAAINRGLEYVKGEFLIWPDSDDILNEYSVEARVNFLNSHRAYNAVRSIPDYFDTKTGEAAKPRENIDDGKNENLFWEILENRSYVSCGCYMFKSTLFFNIYPNRKIPEYPVGQNFQMLLPYLYRYPCATISKKLYRVRVHDKSHSVRKLNLLQSLKKLLRFEALVDDITEISGIHNEIELRKINRWKMHRRRVFATAWIEPHFHKTAFRELIFRGYLRVLHTFRKIVHTLHYHGDSQTARNLINKKSSCSGCGACSNICPVNAIEMRLDSEGFTYPSINPMLCIGCEACTGVCPMINSQRLEKKCEGFYAAKAYDDDLRYASSSGGVFPVLANYVFEKNGVVFGAAMEERGIVRHIAIEKPSDIKKIQGTKYVQSEIGHSYKQIKKLLDRDVFVMFVGTPCQCEGLKLYLHKEYENLFIADLICYGVPSLGIWNKYVRHLESKFGGELTSYYFRDKRNKDRGHTVACNIKGKEHTWKLNDDIYCSLYFDNNIIRPSCYECKYCTEMRSSDITLGDFWGVENIYPELNDEMGTSLVITHTQKGEEIVNASSARMEYYKCSKQQAQQPRLQSPTEKKKHRRFYIKLYMHTPFIILLPLINIYRRSKRKK
ncbi:MAG: Coenzyme F420 hydrogenase/dehydrogenase, beta subunit C-terminal domain [Clostridium sp.]|nr:Coenzyme F420 hydrogenase/dehydrogenase, beta subunit C-terminal domain [Clostridium sp.]